MSRRLISCLVLILLFLQGIAVASADIVGAPVQTEEHCRGHDHAKAGQPCACCGDHQTMNDSCASVCSTTAIVSTFTLSLIRPSGAEHDAFIDRFAKNPAYLPLNPPPIS